MDAPDRYSVSPVREGSLNDGLKIDFGFRVLPDSALAEGVSPDEVRAAIDQGLAAGSPYAP